MKKYNRWSTFLSGMLAGAMIVGCGTAALAAGGGSVTLGSMGLMINGKTSFTQGETLTNAAGNEIPSTILYTDEAGGGTTYLPIRTISELLNIPVDWEDGMIYLGSKPGGTVTITTGNDVKPDDVWNKRPLHQAGTQAGAFTEVEPIWPANDKITSYSARDETMSTSIGVGGEYNVFPDEGGCCSISITNNTSSDLILSVACVATITRDAFPNTIVPAGETVIRTFRAEEYTGGLYQPNISFFLYRDIARPESMTDTVSAVVTVVSFNPERTGPALFS